jgi:glycosyltransferase involved in cell wall biosynthesis
MRLLLVGLSTSVHMARFAAQARLAGCEVALFSATNQPLHTDFTQLTLFRPRTDPPIRVPAGVDVIELPTLPWPRESAAARAVSLAHAIRRFRPDVVHAHELNLGGHIAADATKMLRDPPPLILTLWGSDIDFGARLADRRARVRRTLSQVDYLCAECERDLQTARRMGFRGQNAAPMPVALGYDVERLAALGAPGPTSGRRTIALKGYQHFAGRAQVALRAVELCGERLRGLTLAVYAVAAAEEQLARRAAERAGMELEIVSRPGAWVEHEQILRMHGRSRVSLAMSIGDGVSQSFLEALVMGSFPIQSSTACVDEWITDGVTGLIIPPEDPLAAAEALRRALADDALVDGAAQANFRTAQARLDEAMVRGRLAELYEAAVSRRRA